MVYNHINAKRRKRKIDIIKALQTPITLKELYKTVPTTCLSQLLAEMKADNLILYNQSTKKLELVNLELL